ncbi:MAG: DHA2 family efflux MFS transporter permease subunit [Acidimicrobiia bacterium]
MTETATAQTRADAAYQKRWWILLVLCFSLLVITLDNTILNVALPTIVRDLHASNSQLQWMVDSYTLIFASLLLTAGTLGDRFGRRGALMVGLAIFGIGSLLCSQASGPSMVIAMRALMGIGGAFIMPATLSILTNVFPPKERGAAIGIWAGVAGIGIALGPLAGGVLLEHFYWGSIFLVNVPVVAIAVPLVLMIIPTSKDPAAPELDIAGSALTIVGLTALLYGLIEAPTKGWTNATILGAFAVGVVFLAAFALWERHTDHPMLDVRFFQNRRFTAASLSVTFVFFALFGTTFLTTQYFQFVLGYNPLQTGYRLLPFALVMMVIAPTSARIVKVVGTKVVVATGLGLVTLGLVLLSQLAVTSSYFDIIWRMMLLAGGMALTMAPATDSIMGALPLSKAGVGSAVNDTTRMVGGALGVAVIGSIMSSIYGHQMADFASKNNLPGELANTVESQIGAALQVAQGLPGALGESVTNAAKEAFVSGMHTAVFVGAAVAALGVLVAAIWLPARPRPEDVADQVAEAELGAEYPN